MSKVAVLTILFVWLIWFCFRAEYEKLTCYQHLDGSACGDFFISIGGGHTLHTFKWKFGRGK